MKLSILTIGLVALLTPLTAAWSKEDREIFRVRDELATHEGPEITFYDFLGVNPSANLDDINKAYKRKARALHPDKVRQQLTAERTKKNKEKGVKVTKAPSQSELKAAVKKASERQARLSIVTNVLRGPGRDRYDHFLKNGFPTWKGTEYYYSRYRPGLGTVLLGCLFVVGGAFHYLALYMSWKRQREFVERYIKYARSAAWGDNFAVPGLDAAANQPAAPAAEDEQQQQQQPPIAMNRKQRRMQEKESRKGSAKETKRPTRGRARGSQQASGSATPVPQAPGSGPTGAKKRVVAQNGKILVVDSLGDVYLEQEDEDGVMQEFLLDPEDLHQPTIKDTALYKLPGFLYGLTIGKVLGKKHPVPDAEDLDIVVDETESDVGVARTPSTDSTDDFELVEATTGSQAQSGGKPKKRTTRKR